MSSEKGIANRKARRARYRAEREEWERKQGFTHETTLQITNHNWEDHVYSFKTIGPPTMEQISDSFTLRGQTRPWTESDYDVKEIARE